VVAVSFAILDGVPLQNHVDLKNHIVIDDPDEIEARCTVEQREHGTFVSSIVINGEYKDDSQINSKVYLRPILGPDSLILENKLLVKLIYEAVEAIFNNESTKDTRVINLSIGDTVRKFYTRISSLAKLIDLLSIKYKVLFLVSAGNSNTFLDLQISKNEFLALDQDAQQKTILKAKRENGNHWKILSPAEAINCISVGASEFDESLYKQTNSINNSHGMLYKQKEYHALYSCIGLGFRNSIKPELLMPGGSPAYRIDDHGNNKCRIRMIEEQPQCGLEVAVPFGNDLNKRQHCAIGTSFATALATNHAIRIYEKLLEKNYISSDPNFDALYIKNLLLHSAYHDDSVKNLVKDLPKEHLVKDRNISRFFGLGVLDFDKAINAYDNSVLILANNYIKLGQEDTYRIPIPKILSSKTSVRRLIATLAWFSPISADSLNYKVARLGLDLPKKQSTNNQSAKATIEKSMRPDIKSLGLINQQINDDVMKSSTIIHTVLEGSDTIIPFDNGLETVLSVFYADNYCGDKAQKIESITYTLAITLEVDEDIDIYTDIKQRIEQKVTLQQTIEVKV
jgi:hypothetical protein